MSARAKTVTATGLTLGGADARNYVLANPTETTTASVAAVSLTPSITASDKVYDSTNSATLITQTLAGVLGGESVSLTGGGATFADKNVGIGKTVTATGFTLSGADAGNYVLGSSSATTAASILARSVTGTVAAAGKNYDGNTSAVISNRSLTGGLSGDVVTLSGGTASFDSKNVRLERP